MTTINDITDLVQILQDHPEWKNTLRGLIIGEELAQVPQRLDRLEQNLADFIEATNRNFEIHRARIDKVESDIAEFKARVDARFDEIDAKFVEVNRRFDRIDGRLDNGFGMNYELKVGKNINALAGQHFGLRRLTVLRDAVHGSTADLRDLIEDAQDDGLLTQEQANELWRLDILVLGRQQGTGDENYMIAELSVTVGSDDVTRVANRAQILRSIVDQPVIPAVIGARIDDARADLAAGQGVLVALLPE